MDRFLEHVGVWSAIAAAFSCGIGMVAWIVSELFIDDEAVEFAAYGLIAVAGFFGLIAWGCTALWEKRSPPSGDG